MSLLITIILLVTSLIQLVCWIWVLVSMFTQDGILWGLFGLLCCQPFVYIWGWMSWKSDSKTGVMVVWTICLLAEALAYVSSGTEVNLAVREALGL